MKINRYIDSKWHKRQIESFKNPKNKPYKDLYFSDILPCIIYVMENTNFEVWFKYDLSSRGYKFNYEYVKYKLNTVKLNDIKKINEYHISKRALKDAIITQIEGYLNCEATELLKNHTAENELDSMLTTNLKDLMVEALSTEQNYVDKYATEEEKNLIDKDKRYRYKLKFKQKNVEKTI